MVNFLHSSPYKCGPGRFHLNCRSKRNHDFNRCGKQWILIVFPHSYLADNSHFNPQIQKLKNRFHCLAFDHRGHGQSEIKKDGYDMENLYADAVGFIEALDCAPCHFVGLSTGGFIGLRIGIRRPDHVKSLVLMDTSADEETKEALRQYRQMLFVARWRKTNE